MNPVLLLFVDGLGLPPSSRDQTFPNRNSTPALHEALTKHCVPLDACLGIPGLPQSATGQTAMLTGRNAPAVLGRHKEGFPNQQLRHLIRDNNIFLQLKQLGKSSTFANGYLARCAVDVQNLRTPSVTTVACMEAFGHVRYLDDLLKDNAVAHDLTRESLVPRGYDGPLISPEQAAMDLFKIACQYDFTLFEFFETDRAGHSGRPQQIASTLQKLDTFLKELMRHQVNSNLLLALTSDHGNIEEPTTRSHTRNPVPFVAIGHGADALLASARELTDVTPALIEHICAISLKS